MGAYNAIFDTAGWGETTLAGVIAYSANSFDGTTRISRSTVGVISVGGGVYQVSRTANSDWGDLCITWDNGTDFARDRFTVPVAADASGQVIVGDYFAGKDPATYILLNTTRKLYTGETGAVDVRSFNGDPDKVTQLAAAIGPDGLGVVRASDGQPIASESALGTLATAVGVIGSAVSAIGTIVTATAAIFSGMTSLPKWLRALMRSSTPDTTALTEINAGGGTYDAATDSEQAVRDRGDAAWVTGESDPGDGDTEVDHNTGGTDNLRYVRSGVGVDNATVRAYLKTDFDAGTYTLRGRTFTRSDGRWVAPMMLNAGLTYTFRFEKPGVYGPDLEEEDVT